jgi:hypothetical protein
MPAHIFLASANDALNAQLASSEALVSVIGTNSSIAIHQSGNPNISFTACAESQGFIQKIQSGASGN